MAAESDLFYFHRPTAPRPVRLPVEFLTTQELLTDEPACKVLWSLIDTQFRTRSKFLAIWPGVRYAALHRTTDGTANGFLLVTCPVNWQIDYVVVHPDARGQGIAPALVTETLNRAYEHKAPYVMLSSRAALRPLYESCGFIVVPASGV
jgi:ribosomal protein S18 acetylase RimI-like enzyme